MLAVALLTLDLRIVDSRSLKDRRQVVRSLKDRLRKRFNVSVAETDFQNRIGSAEISVATVAAQPGDAERLLEEVERAAGEWLGRDLESASIEILTAPLTSEKLSQ